MEINSKEEAETILKEMRRLEKELLKEREKAEEEISNIVKEFNKKTLSYADDIERYRNALIDYEINYNYILEWR
jgi:F0F1-type ATP synthase membrane subunit b/b'